MPTVYLNGQFLPLEAARVPVMDRGFLFGDGVYEVIPVYDRRPFRLEDHLARLRASLDGIRLGDPHSAAEWTALIERIVEIRPTVFLMPLELPAPPPALIEHGVAAITAADTRWSRCDIKATSLLANVLLRQLSVDAGCAETLLIRDGLLMEGSASSVFLVRGSCPASPTTWFSNSRRRHTSRPRSAPCPQPSCATPTRSGSPPPPRKSSPSPAWTASRLATANPAPSTAA